MYSLLPRARGSLFIKKTRKIMANPEMIQIGMQAAESAAKNAGGTIFSRIDEWLFGDSDRKKQLKQQQALINQQVTANKDLAENNKRLEFDLWNKTNYGAQVAHMKDAGLNPALMYGQAGQGVTGTAGQSASSGHASTESERAQARAATAGMALQLGLQQAQIENMKADTKKKEAEAENVGKDTEVKGWSIEQIKQGIEVMKSDVNLKDAQEELTKLQQVSTEIQNDYNKVNNPELIKQSIQVTKQLLLQNQLTEATKETLIETAKANLRNLIADVALKKSNITLNDANIQNILNSIQVANKQLIINEKQLTNAWNIATLNSQSGQIPNTFRAGVKVLSDIFRDLGFEVNEREGVNFKK